MPTGPSLGPYEASYCQFHGCHYFTNVGCPACAAALADRGAEDSSIRRLAADQVALRKVVFGAIAEMRQEIFRLKETIAALQKRVQALEDNSAAPVQEVW